MHSLSPIVHRACAHRACTSCVSTLNPSRFEPALTIVCFHRHSHLHVADPMVYADPLSWTRDPAVIGVMAGAAAALLMLITLLMLWAVKSRHRRWEKLMRRRSVRSSARSTRSLVGVGSRAGSRGGSMVDVSATRRTKLNVSREMGISG